MKQTLTLLFLLFTGCSSVIDVKPVNTYALNEVKTASIGDTFFVAETGTLKRFKH